MADTAQSKVRDTGTGTSNPLDPAVTRQIDAVAAGNDQNTEIGKALWTGTVTKIEYIPNGAAAQDANNFRTWTVTNKTTGLAMGTLSTHTAASDAKTLVQATEADFTLNATAANIACTQDDVLEVESAHTAAGVADPGGVVRVHIQPTLGQTP